MKYVAISIHGHYLSLNPEAAGSVGALLQGQLGILRADGGGIGDPSIFERVERGEHEVSFRMLDGQWLQEREAVIGRTADEAAATVFTEVWWPDDRISLRAPTRRFVCAEQGGGQEVVVNRSEAADWEKFFYEQVPAELLPPEPAPAVDISDSVRSSVAGALRDSGRSDAISDVTRRLYP